MAGLASSTSFRLQSRTWSSPQSSGLSLQHSLVERYQVGLHLIDKPIVAWIFHQVFLENIGAKISYDQWAEWFLRLKKWIFSDLP
jgi:hypothetical protein